MIATTPIGPSAISLGCSFHWPHHTSTPRVVKVPPDTGQSASTEARGPDDRDGLRQDAFDDSDLLENAVHERYAITAAYPQLLDASSEQSTFDLRLRTFDVLLRVIT